jgi:hypothetical protein
VREPLWQRLRRERREAGDDESDESDEPDASTRSTERDVVDALRHLNRSADGDGDGADAATDRQAAYAEWAERMKQKRAEKQATIRGDAAQPQAASYWSSDALFEESKRLEDDLAKAVQTRSELLAVLGLPPTADADEVQRQYRRLAKEHHPDRYPEADPEIRDHHAEQMHRINAAYRALQDVHA